MKALILVFIMLFNQIAFACDKPVTYLKEGTLAVCTGYLFSPEKEKEVRETAIKYNTMEQLNSKQEELIVVLQQRVYVGQQVSDNLRKENESLESKNRMDQIIYFSLGLVLGLGAAKVLTK